MPAYHYQKTDAFTAVESRGNPAATLFYSDPNAFPEAAMLEIAREHKGFVSEVVYCLHRSDSDIHLTYYSSECEVDFCGHGTIACMYGLIRNTPALLDRPEIHITTNRRGPLTVYNRIPAEDAVLITAPEPVFHDAVFTREQVAPHLGLAPEQLSDRFPIRIVNAGLNTLIVPVGTLQDEVSVFPAFETLRRFCEQIGVETVLLFSMEVADKQNFAHTRVFPPVFGYLEDPATGSGNSAFGCYLHRHGLWDGAPISIEQGGSDRIFNRVNLMLRGDQLLFGGSATVRIDGSYYC